MHAWDYQGVIEGIYNGGAQLPHGVIPATMWGYDHELKPPEFDLDKARAYLEKSGIPEADRKIKIQYTASDTPFKNAALTFQSNLGKIGIQAELDPGDWGKIWSEARNLASSPNVISMTWWPTYPTPGDWLKGLFVTEKVPLFNLSHYSNPAFDAMVAEGYKRSGNDRTAAIAAFQQAQRLLMKDAVGVFYADVAGRIIHRSDVLVPPSNPAYTTIFFYQTSRKGQ